MQLVLLLFNMLFQKALFKRDTANKIISVKITILKCVAFIISQIITKSTENDQKLLINVNH